MKRRELLSNPLLDAAIYVVMFCCVAFAIAVIVTSFRPAAAATPAVLVIDAGMVVVSDPPADLRCDARGWEIRSADVQTLAVSMDASLMPVGLVIVPAVEACVMRDGYEGF